MSHSQANQPEAEAKPAASEAPSASPAETAAGATAVPAAGATAVPAADAAGQVDTLRKEREEYYQHYLRALADLENYRRRVAREKEELRQFATRDLMEALVPVFEGLGLALASARQATDPQAITRGVSMVLEQFRSTLAAKGLVEINPAAGADFDPHQHESIAHAPSETVPEEKILQVVRPGFSLNGRLLRPASVVLASGKAPAQPA